MTNGNCATIKLTGIEPHITDPTLRWLELDVCLLNLKDRQGLQAFKE
jgi:hypothetical protein